MDNIKWLQKYFLECCNGDWEHTHQIKIGTLDNPGWLVDIDIKDTTLENISFPEIESERDEHNWIFCRVVDKVFKGRGGVTNLDEILTVFRDWVSRVEGAPM
jgi:hypothetical protein